jgi:hypothetical protein
MTEFTPLRIMEWPGLQAKLLPVSVLRLAGWEWPSVGGPDAYFGCWLHLAVGRWVICFGRGRYIFGEGWHG